MSKPLNEKLYSSVKLQANEVFSSKTGVYRSSWIVREYKKQGGIYSASPIVPSNGLKQWYKEKWVDLNRPIYDNNKPNEVIGYEPCGRKTTKNTDIYPLCRPSVKVSVKTPKTYKELSKSSLDKAKADKAKVKGTQNIKFQEPKKKISDKKKL